MAAFFASHKVFCTKSAKIVWLGHMKEQTTKNAKKNSKSKKGDEDQGLERVDSLRAGE